MPQRVYVTGHGFVEFPDDASPQEIQSALDQEFPVPSPTVGETAKSAFGALTQGAAGVVGSMPKSVGIVQGAITGDEPEKTLPYRIGQGIEDKVAETLPEDPRLKGKSFLWSTLPQAVGSTAGFAATGLAGQIAAPASLARIAGPAITAATGAAAGGVEGYEDAKRSGADRNTAFTSFLINAGVGTSEALPLGRIFDRINRDTKGALKALVEAGTSAAEEGAQETLQQIAANMVAQHLYDSDRQTMEGVLEGGAAGAATGFLATVLGKGVRRAAGIKGDEHSAIDVDLSNNNPTPSATPAPAAGIPGDSAKFIDVDLSNKNPVDQGPPAPEAAPATVAQPAPAVVTPPVQPTSPPAPDGSDKVTVDRSLLEQIQDALKGNQVAEVPVRRKRIRAWAEEPEIAEDKLTAAEDRTRSMPLDEQVGIAEELAQLPRGEWTEDQRIQAEALRGSETLKDGNRDMWRAFFARTVNEDRHNDGKGPIEHMSAGLEDGRLRLFALGSEEDERQRTPLSKQAEDLPTNARDIDRKHAEAGLTDPSRPSAEEWQELLKPDPARDLKQIGISPHNIEALLRGDRTAEQVVDAQMGIKRGSGSIDAATLSIEENADGTRTATISRDAGPAAHPPKNIGTLSHAEAIMMARDQAISDIRAILRENKISEAKTAPDTQPIKRPFPAVYTVPATDTVSGVTDAVGGSPVQARNVEKAQQTPQNLTGSLPASTVQRPPETITGPDEREGSVMPAESGGNPLPRATLSKRRNKPARESVDLIDIIESEIGRSAVLVARTATRAARFKEMYDSGDYADFVRTGHGRRLVSVKGKFSPDQVVQALVHSGSVRPDFTVEDLWRGLMNAVRTRRSAKPAVNSEAAVLEKEAAASLDFAKRAIRKTDRAGSTVPATSLDVGDKFTVDGAGFVVAEVVRGENGEINHVILDDGRRFGTQIISGNLYLKPDPDSLQHAAKAEEADDIPFSLQRGESAGMSQADLEAVADRLAARMPGSLPTVVVQSIKDLPEPLQRAGVQGAVWKARAYLVADNISSVEEAERKWIHEQVGHHGLRAVLGDETGPMYQAILRAYDGTAQLREILQRYALNPSEEADANEAAEELLAHLAEHTDSHPGLWRSIVAAVKKAWRRITGGEISEDEVKDLIARAFRHLETKEETKPLPGSERPRFALKPDDYWKRHAELSKRIVAAKSSGDAKDAVAARKELTALEMEQHGVSAKKSADDDSGLPPRLDANKGGSSNAEPVQKAAEKPSTSNTEAEPTAKPAESTVRKEAAPAKEPPGASTESTPDHPEFTPARILNSDEVRRAVMDVESATANPTLGAGSWKGSAVQFLRHFATNIPELPVFGEMALKFAPFKRWYRETKSATEFEYRRTATDVAIVFAPLAKLGHEVLDTATLEKNQNLTNKIQAELAKGDRANMEFIGKWQDMRDALYPRLIKSPRFLKETYIMWRDLDYRVNHMQTEDGGPITPPAGLSPEQVSAQTAERLKTIEASPHRAAILESVSRHDALMMTAIKEMEQRGEIIPDALRNPHYFPHHVLENWTGRIDRVRATTEGPWRYYLMPITGTAKLHQADYSSSVYKHIADVRVHNAQIDLVERDIKPYNIAEKHLEELTERFGEEKAHRLLFDERFLPPDHVVMRPAERLKLGASSVIDREKLSEVLGRAVIDSNIGEQFKEAGIDISTTVATIREALTSGEEQLRWIVPKEVKAALDGIAKRENQAANPGFGTLLMRPLATFQKAWKVNTLHSPINWPRYEYGNFVTDLIDKVWGNDPEIAKYMGQASREIREGEAGNDSEHYSDALRQGVMQTVTAGEAQDIVGLKQFEEYLSTPHDPRRVMRKMAEFLPGKSARRESVFRYASYLANINRMERGERPRYGGAYWREVEAQSTNAQKAGMIARKTFGDYHDIGVAGQWMRTYVFPFWSWSEVNLGYHANLLRNTYDMVRLKEMGAAKDSAKAAAIGIVLRLAMIRLAFEMWNQAGGVLAGLWDKDDDLESQLSEADRRKSHLILGKDSKGRVRVLYLPSALADVSEWFGGNNFSRLFMEYAKGDISLGRFVRDYAKEAPSDFLNKVASGVRPEAKYAYMMISGKDPFPDILNQRPIKRDEWHWMMGQAVDRDATQAIRSMMDPFYYSPETGGEWLQRKILQVRRRDPEQWAYYEVRNLASDWKEERTGKSSEGGSYTSRDQMVVRDFRKAIYNGDMENAAKFYLAALSLGYTKDRFKASLRAQDPLADLNKEERKEFVASLNPYEQRMLGLSQKYYGRISSGKGKEADLFPKKSGAAFTPRPDRLRELMGAGR